MENEKRIQQLIDKLTLKEKVSLLSGRDFGTQSLLTASAFLPS